MKKYLITDITKIHSHSFKEVCQKAIIDAKLT